MFKMLQQLWSALATLCLALEKLANAGVHLASTAELHAKSFADEAELENAEKVEQLKLRLATARKANEQQLIEA